MLSVNKKNAYYTSFFDTPSDASQEYGITAAK